MKKILIIGAGFLQSFLIKKSKDMGYYTIAIDKDDYAVGFQYADEYEVIDIVDQDACLKYAEYKNIGGVITAATDHGVLTTAYISKMMDLPGIDYDVASIIKNKYAVRRILFENNVDDIAQYYEIKSTEELSVIDKLHYPLMVKPSDGSGSKAAKRVNSITQLKETTEKAINSSLLGKALIEDFIKGEEFGVESFVYDDEIYILGIMGKYMTYPPNYAELGHYMPAQLTIEDKVKDVVIKAIRVLGINFGSVNMDVLVTDDNRVCIIDVGARMGGNLIGSHIIPKGTGVDYMANLIRSAVDDPIDLECKYLGINVVTRLLALSPGRIRSLPNLQYISKKNNVEIYHQLQVGAEIRPYENNLDGFGYVVSQSYNMNKAIEQAENALNMTDKGIERERFYFDFNRLE